MLRGDSSIQHSIWLKKFLNYGKRINQIKTKQIEKCYIFFGGIFLIPRKFCSTFFVTFFGHFLLKCYSKNGNILGGKNNGKNRINSWKKEWN